MLAIIGGTGLYQIDKLEIITEHQVNTPFGLPSDKIIEGKLNNKTLFFLPRHGKNHSLLPSEINYRANIFALKSLGVTKVISISACGSLREEIKRGDLVIANQYLDYTKGQRKYSFFGEGLVAHISTADPTCPNLTDNILSVVKKLTLPIHSKKTYVAVEGPRLGTRAESNLFRKMDCDIVGMTNVPEVFLAREAQISYITIAIVTDYDCFKEGDSTNVAEIIKTYQENIINILKIIEEISKIDLSDSPDLCRKSLLGNVITKQELWTKKQQEILKILQS